MQFMPATWAAMGVDGDGDGRADITNDADSVFSAANYLTKSGVTKLAPAGVRAAHSSPTTTSTGTSTTSCTTPTATAAAPSPGPRPTAAPTATGTRTCRR